MTFIERPLSAVFIGLTALLVGAQIFAHLRGSKKTVAESRILETIDNPTLSGVSAE
jgi:hypothetical protein